MMQIILMRSWAVTKLSAKELDLLQRVDDKEDLRPLFFRKVKGLKWFNALSERGYFNPEANPRPIPAKEEEYVSIPHWSVIDYLVKTAPELALVENVEYVEKYVELLVTITNYAKKHNFSNYRTWWQFSEIISHIPPDAISLDQIDIVDYWLDDKYERDLVAQEIGEKWLPKVLETSDAHNLQIASKLLTFLYKVTFVERKLGERLNREAILRIDKYYADRITKKVAHLAGVKLGREAVLIFDSYLKYILRNLKNDLWSSIWHPSIGEHEQNKYRDDAENLLINAYRDSLDGYIETKPKEASDYIQNMLKEEYQTIDRLAIHAISRKIYLFHNLIDALINKNYLNSNYRHEMWHLLNSNYQQFSAGQKQKILDLINNISETDEEGNIHKNATAYNKAIWLAAIKNHGKKEASLYQENVGIAKTEPDHPDFSSYMSGGWVVHESPIPIEELQSLSIEELVEVLKTYRDSGGFREPGIEGLVKTFKQIVKASPLNYYNELIRFSELDLAYIHEIIEAYRDLWTEKAQLPWNDIWLYLLDFCYTVIKQDRFWDIENTKRRDHFVANRYWIVSAIGRLLVAGTKSDDHAFSEEYLQKSEDIIVFLLKNEEGNEFKIDSDAVSISINSPRGHCLEALINLTLRSCRISDKKNNKDHSEVWTHFQPLYDDELARTDIRKPEYEFATLITNYLPNFLYMSKSWVLAKLERIFDQRNYLKWLCAMQGYAYVNTVYQEVYIYLKENGDFIKALNDDNIKDRVQEKIIQNIAVAYISNFEMYPDENSLIRTLVSRKDFQELNHLIWFIWTLHKKRDQKLKEKVFELWPNLLEVADITTREGKRMASQLCHWAIFIDKVDDEKRNFLLAIAPYADEAYNAYKLLKSIANISQIQPFEAHTIWMKMLEGSWQDYPEEAVRKILTNLVSQGSEGMRMAKEAVSEYLKRGNERPAVWLREIKNEK
jgi:hypothetical protein